jgi:hypothetical protein
MLSTVPLLVAPPSAVAGADAVPGVSPVDAASRAAEPFAPAGRLSAGVWCRATGAPFGVAPDRAGAVHAPVRLPAIHDGSSQLPAQPDREDVSAGHDFEWLVGAHSPDPPDADRDAQRPADCQDPGVPTAGHRSK